MIQDITGAFNSNAQPKSSTTSSIAAPVLEHLFNTPIDPKRFGYNNSGQIFYEKLWENEIYGGPVTRPSKTQNKGKTHLLRNTIESELKNTTQDDSLRHGFFR